MSARPGGLKRVSYDLETEPGSDVQDEHKAVLYKLIDIFSIVTRKRLILKEADEPSTDGIEVRVPISAPNAYRLLEHQLAHVLFETDARARRFFIEDYWQGLQKRQLVHPTKLLPQSFLRSLESLIDILDNYRVKDLWSYVYAGSYEEIAAHDRKLFLSKLPKQPDCLVDVFLRFAACGVTPGNGWEKYTSILTTALNRVAGKTYTAVLATARWLIVELVSEWIREKQSPIVADIATVSPVGPPDNEPDTSQTGDLRWEALSEVTSLLGVLPVSLAGAINNTEESEIFGATGEGYSRNKVTKALRVDHADPDFLEEEKLHMQNVLTDAISGLATAESEDRGLHQNVHAKVVIHDIGHSPSGVQPVVLGLEDEQTVEELQQIFRLVHSRRKNTLEEYGFDVDIDAYIERRLTGVPIPVFRQEERGQGFHALLLLDKSVSMGKYKDIAGKKVLSPKTALAKAYRACRIITKALAFPFVRLDVWGFASRQDGCVEIVRYDPSRDTFDTTMTDFSGTTPLHASIRLGALHLAQSTEKRQLFAITDGLPTFTRHDGARISQDYLIRAVAREVKEARAAGTAVTGVLLEGEDASPISDEHAGVMFGPTEFWRRLQADTFGQDLVTLVAGTFINFLRTR